MDALIDHKTTPLSTRTRISTRHLVIPDQAWREMMGRKENPWREMCLFYYTWPLVDHDQNTLQWTKLNSNRAQESAVSISKVWEQQITSRSLGRLETRYLMDQRWENPSSHSSSGKVFALEEALCAQHQVIQNLQLEIDMERECAATAASEALSMILRLQEVKASQEMEARQYKKVTEEKLRHVEDTLVFYEEVMHWKDMYISSLELQLETCREKLLSAGFHDFDIRKMNIAKMTRTSVPIMKHEHSILEFKLVEKEDILQRLREENADLEETHKETCNQISTRKDINVEASSHSTSSLLKSDAGAVSAHSSSRMRSFDSLSELDLHSTPSTESQCASMVVHDVYEIPQHEKKEAHGLHFDEKRASLTTFEDMQPPSVNHISGVQPSKSAVLNAGDKNREYRKMQLPSGNSINDHVESKFGSPISQSDYLKIDHRLHRLEKKRFSKDIQESGERQREIQLLSEITDQLRSIQMHIRSLKPLKPEKQSLPEEYMDYVTQVMMSFSL